MLHSKVQAERSTGDVGTLIQKTWATAVKEMVTLGAAIIFKEQNPSHLINEAHLTLIHLKTIKLDNF